MATIYHGMGIDPEREFLTPEGRPVPIVPGTGRVISELFLISDCQNRESVESCGL